MSSRAREKREKYGTKRKRGFPKSPGKNSTPAAGRHGGIFKNKLVCFGCRRTGHSLRDCRYYNGGDASGRRGEKICYNCGSSEHALRDCPEPNSNFAFAKCFVCDKVGHLSKNCPENKSGLYVNGGQCRICKGVDHLAKDCPKRGVCLRCGEKGHLSKECPNKKSKRKEE